jgi:hypothetical protein
MPYGAKIGADFNPDARRALLKFLLLALGPGALALLVGLIGLARRLSL